MHCWHQKVRVRPALPSDRYGDIHVDHAKARGVYRKWLALTRPASGRLRRPIWLFRPVKPALEAYQLEPSAPVISAVQAIAGAGQPSAFEYAELVDWSPAEVWGPLQPPPRRQSRA